MMSLYFICLGVTTGAAIGSVIQTNRLVRANAALARRAHMAESFAQLVLDVCGDEAMRTCCVCSGRIHDRQPAAVHRPSVGMKPRIAHAMCLPPMDDGEAVAQGKRKRYGWAKPTHFPWRKQK